MIDNKKIIAIIPARGGSKGVVEKNIRVVAKKPLLAWTIEAAKHSLYIDHLILSSDDDDIISIAQQYGCDVPFRRPTDLSTDEAQTIDVVLHALDYLKDKYDYVVLLQPTSPLRSTEDIDSCIKLCIGENVGSVVSMSMVEKSPYWMYWVDAKNKIKPVVAIEDRPSRRQDAGNACQLNGAVYVTSVNKIKNERVFITKDARAYIMPEERSLDIDTMRDFELLEKIVSSTGSLVGNDG